MRTVFRRTMIATALAVSGLTAVGAAGAVAAPVGSSTYTNPVAGHPWGIYKGTADKLWSAYRHSTGTDRTLLGRIASRPRTRWYSAYIPASKIADKIRTDVAQEQHGNNNVQVWMALFRLWPHGESAAKQPLSSSDLAAYKTWMRNAARAIGSTRAVVVLEPDLAVALNGWHPAVRERLVRYAAHLLGALPNATVYLDGSSSDWLPAATSVKLLRASGIRYVHGFALGITHHPSTASEVGYGRSVVAVLAKSGLPGKHFVVDTSDNGHPYTYRQFQAAHPHGSPGDPIACSARVKRACVSLGIPPTTDVTNQRWRLPASIRPTLRSEVDAFMWMRLSWLTDGDKTFSLPYALNIARSQPHY